MQLESNGMTRTGRRARNEDALFAETGLGLFAVADGLGGHQAGDVASSLAIDAIATFISDADEESPVSWPLTMRMDRSLHENLIEAALHMAHREVVAARDLNSSNMGSTLSALLFRNGHAIVGHVGDSRVYRLRDGALAQLTRDHSLYADFVDKGMSMPRGRFPFSNIVTQALGMRGRPDAEVRIEAVLPGDVYLLCTDGLTNVLSDHHIGAIMSRYSPDEACSRLIDDAYDWGSTDNITAVIVKVAA